MQSVTKNSKRVYSIDDSTNNARLNSRITTLENNEYKITYYEIVSGTSGSLTVPTGATLNSGEFGLSGNSILSKIDGSNKPTFESPKTSGGTIVTANLNTTNGSWTTSGVYTDPQVALIYSIRIKAKDYSNLNYNRIIESENIYEDKVSKNGDTMSGQLILPSIVVNGTGGSGYADFQIQSSDPSVPGSGIRRLYFDAGSRLGTIMSNGVKAVYRAKIYSDIIDGPAHTGTTANTILKSYEIPANTYNVGETLRIESVHKKTVSTGSFNNRFMYNTSNSLSGAVQLSSQSANSSATFFSQVRNGQIKSSSNTEFYSSTNSLSSDEGVGSPGGFSSVNIDYTNSVWIISAGQFTVGTDSIIPSVFKIFKD